MVPALCLWYASLKMFGENGENDGGESKSKSVDAGSRASHERWFNHFTKDSMT